jgi:hypothetical protein
LIGISPICLNVYFGSDQKRQIQKTTIYISQNGQCMFMVSALFLSNKRVIPLEFEDNFLIRIAFEMRVALETNASLSHQAL